jgi:hypothetical protein
MGRHLAVPDNNQLLWQQMIGNMDGKTGYLFKWQNTTGHRLVLSDIYLAFTTNTGTGTNAAAIWADTSLEPASVPASPNILAATAVASATTFLVGTKDVVIEDGQWIQVAIVTDTSTNKQTPVTSAACSGVVGFRYTMVPKLTQIS